MGGTRQRLAKLTRPRLNRPVARERLFRLLDQARERHPAVAVLGPPGAGKTTLAGSWLESRSVPGVWYHVDSGDADLATFFFYLGEAVKLQGRKGRRPLPLLTAEYRHDLEAFSRRFFRELFARLPERAALVLDNYQELAPDQPLHRLISQAIGEIPVGSMLLVVSRHGLPDCYARWIANADLMCIDWPQLKLTLDETCAIAASKGHADMDLIGLIHARADGWAAGVALMVEGARAPAARVEVSVDTPQSVFDYFAAEAFGRLDREARSVLRATAWLPSVDATVAAALTGSVRAAGILEDLYRRHLFVHRRRGDPPTYEYHALFRRFLQSESQRELTAAALTELKARAAHLLEQTGAEGAALALYCDTHAWDAALRVVETGAPRLLAHGRGKTLAEWAAKLPVDRRTPWLQYWLGVAGITDAPWEARERLRQALHAFEASGDRIGRILCLAGILESHWAEFSGNEEIDTCLNHALPLLDDRPPFPGAETELRVLCVLYATMLLRQPRNARIAPMRARILSFVTAPVSNDAKLLAGGALLADALQTGRLASAGHVVAALGALAERGHVSPVARLMWALRLPMYFTHTGDYRLAQAAWARAHALLTEEGVLIGHGFLYYTGAFDCVVAGDLSAAAMHVSQLEQVHASVDRPLYRDLALWLRCLIALARGDAHAAAALGREALARARARGLTWPIVWFGVATIHALLEAGEHREAQAEIEALRAFVRGTFMEHFEVELLLAQAWLALQRNDRPQSDDLMRRAWTLAREQDFIFGYRSAFRAHRVLFAESLRREIEPDYVRGLIGRYRLRPEDPNDDIWPWPIKVLTLGRFGVSIDDKPLAFGRKIPRKPLLLLKAIVALGEQGVPEARVIDALWPDEEGDAARHALTLTVHRLRRLLGHQRAVIVADGVLALDAELVWTDVRAFEAVADDGERDAHACASALLKWYRGSFLAEDADAPWTVSRRERLRARFLNAVERAGSALEHTGSFDEASALYLRGLEADPLAELFYQGLLRCHLRQGRHAEAISLYRRLRQTLSIVLGVQPSPGTEALMRDLRA
jgi:DNA-binding SARP family transcriptional activator